MAVNKIPRVPVREQDPAQRATNFKEVCLGYSLDEATLEASRCLNCPKPRCVQGCPVSLQIPRFIQALREGDLRKAAGVIAEDSSLPAVCGRVCPQENQCEGKCVRGIKGEPVGIGRLERFVADWHRENVHTPAAKPEPNGHKVAVIGAGPSGLTVAGDLAKLGYKVTVYEALHVAGGVLMYGIPEFRLPKDIVQHEVEGLKELGVDIECNMVIGKVLTIDELMNDYGFEAIYIASGARGMERGGIDEPWDDADVEPYGAMELVRLAVPRRVYTVSQMNYLIDRICWLYDNRELIGGLKFETEGPHNFYDKLNSVSDWPEKLAAKFRMDFGDSL